MSNKWTRFNGAIIPPKGRTETNKRMTPHPVPLSSEPELYVPSEPLDDDWQWRVDRAVVAHINMVVEYELEKARLKALGLVIDTCFHGRVIVASMGRVHPEMSQLGRSQPCRYCGKYGPNENSSMLEIINEFTIQMEDRRRADRRTKQKAKQHRFDLQREYLKTARKLKDQGFLDDESSFLIGLRMQEIRTQY